MLSCNAIFLPEFLFSIAVISFVLLFSIHLLVFRNTNLLCFRLHSHIDCLAYRKQYYGCPDDKTFRYMASVYSQSHYNMSLSKEFEGGITNGALW